MSTNPKRLEFHLARKASNGFRNALNPDERINLQNRANVSDPKIERSLFDPEIVASNMIWKKVCRVGPGLFNLGNTCYLNSTLQCLLYIPALTQILLIESKNDLTGSGSQELKFVTHQYRRVLMDVWSTSSGKSISPRGLVQNIRRIGKQFRPTRQEDAHEFLRQLLDCMHEEVLKSLRIKPVDGRLAETTFICRIFGGYLRNELRCTKCPYSSKTSNHFQDLSLELPNGIKSVKEAIDLFIRPEKLTAGNEWKCDGCKQRVQATKQMTISKSPKVLVLHLKRFSFGNMFGKINRHITFSLFLDLPCSEEDTKLVKYECTGVLVHHGSSSHSGHYVAFVKAPNGTWYEMDDNRVSVRSGEQVLRQNAYILFYCRVPKPPSTSSVAPSSAATSAALVPASCPQRLNQREDKQAELKLIPAESCNKDKEGKSCGASPASEIAKATVSDEGSKREKASKVTLDSSAASTTKPRLRLRQRRLLLPMRFEGPLKRLTKWKARLSLKETVARAADSTIIAAKVPSNASMPLHQDLSAESTSFPSQSVVFSLKSSAKNGEEQATKRNGEHSQRHSNASEKLVGVPTRNPHDSSGVDVSARILHESRRGREVGGEGFWEDVGLAEVQQVQAVMVQQRRLVQQAQQAKRPNDWNRQLDQGRVKKIKTKAIDYVESNNFQAFEDNRNLKKALSANFQHKPSSGLTSATPSLKEDGDKSNKRKALN